MNFEDIFDYSRKFGQEFDNSLVGFDSFGLGLGSWKEKVDKFVEFVEVIDCIAGELVGIEKLVVENWLGLAVAQKERLK